ncbi:ABC transporter ATP-binding protein [Zavarzinia sp. CC-PAN008]|uniref:ABC transporter ATP-binding protein n=1 Tax=Zavarzinia sp. CC-PAN008 TaxID=3243332 RepID=UPI003F7476C9
MDVFPGVAASCGDAALAIVGAALAHGGAPLFQDLDLPLARGRWTCLLGRSGTGKSSLLRALAGLRVPGLTATRLGDQGRVAWMAQGDLLLPWASLCDNVTMGQRLRGERPDRARALDLLARVGLGDKALRRPGTLSGGERQRVALARTLAEDTAIVLMDEPFSALDAVTRHELHALTVRLLAGRTVCLVTHDPFEALRLADRIAVLRGRPARLDWIDPPPGPTPRAAGHESLARAHGRLLALLGDTDPA